MADLADRMWGARPLAVVVGAGGLGLAIARRLGQSHRLLIADRDAAHLARIEATLAEEGHGVATVACDVSDPAAVTAASERAGTLGALRLLVHVVGLSPSMGTGATILTVNLIGAALAEQAFAPLAGEGAAGIFIASLAAHLAKPSDALVAILDDPLQPDLVARVEEALDEPLTPQRAYSLSKFALIRMCERRAASWGTRGARIVSLSPGLIATPMGIAEFRHSPAKYTLLERTPLQRQGGMSEIADAVEFLGSDRASFISGTDLRVDGGIAAALKHAPDPRFG